MESLEALSSSFLTLLKDSSKSDVKLVCPGEGEVCVHDLILSVRSSVFHNMLRSDMTEKKTGNIIIKDFGIEVVKEMVHYIYTGKIGNESFENVKDLLVIADKYQLNSLVKICSKKLAETLTKDNVIGMGVFGETHSAKVLVESCANFLATDLSILHKNWEDEVKTSPLFLTKVLEALRSSKPGLDVSRFISSNTKKWNCDGSNMDAISFTINREAKLLQIGLFGNHTFENIPVKVEVRKGPLLSSVSLKFKTTYRSNGTTVPVNVPVNVKIDKDVAYTVSVVIDSNEHGTFRGGEGKEEVCFPTEEFKVNFKNTPESSNSTTLTSGQIPTLKFVI